MQNSPVSFEPTFLHWLELIVVAIIAGLIGNMRYIFKKHVEEDRSTATGLTVHLKECSEKNGLVSKVLARLEESVESKHEENRNTTAALTQAISRLNTKLDRNCEDMAFIKGALKIKHISPIPPIDSE